MTKPKWTVDAHCHWSDPRTDGAKLLPQMIAAGILGFQLGGVEPSEWARQSALRDQFPRHIWRAFGLHPYFVAREPRATLELAWTELQKQAAEVEALGETGLDFRKQYLTNGKDIQREFFRRHLAMASGLRKPVVLHIVRAHEEALQDLKFGPISGMVHAFTQGPKIGRRYLDMGLHLSVGAKLLFPDTQDLAETVKFMPLERLLLESDGPDQPPPGRQVHDSTTVWALNERVAELKKLPLEQVIEQTRANLLALIDRELRP